MKNVKTSRRAKLVAPFAGLQFLVRSAGPFCGSAVLGRKSLLAIIAISLFPVGAAPRAQQQQPTAPAAQAGRQDAGATPAQKVEAGETPALPGEAPENLHLLVGRSLVISSPARIRRISVADPSIIDTLVVNPQGCGVRLRRALEPGYRVALDELPAGIGTTATVVSCVPVGADGKFFLIGLALEDRGNVWSIHPAPADWNTEPQPAAAGTSPNKSAQWPYSIFSSKGEAHPGRK